MRSVSEIIKSSLEKIQRANSSFSMRSLAKKLEMSPGQLSKIINGKKVFPSDKLDILCNSLSIDHITREELELSIAIGALDDTYKQRVIRKYNESSPKSHSYEEKGHGSFWILEKWYRWNIHCLLDLKVFSENPELIIDELGIKETTLKHTLEGLLERGLIEFDGERYKRTSANIRFPSTRTHPVVRSFNDSRLQLARKELLENTSQSDFERRLIATNTFTISQEKVPEFKERLHSYIYHLVQELTGDESERYESHDALYQLNYQFFPMTKPLINDSEAAESA